MELKGVYLPIITPFKNDELDLTSYVRTLVHYKDKGLSGVIPLGTTGESPTVEEDEYFQIVEKTLEVVASDMPVIVGAASNSTKKLLKLVKKLEAYPIAGMLSVCPYYNRPSQTGLFEHFKALSESTDKSIIIYNIPYRTGVNLENETLFRLAELKNIIGIKDCCGITKQSFELLQRKPDNFSVLTGEDAFFYTTLVHGGQGGILASCHLHTEKFIQVYELVNQNKHQDALKLWNDFNSFIPFLFKETNPGPVKYCLKELGLLDSEETRMPIPPISSGLKETLRKQVL